VDADFAAALIEAQLDVLRFLIGLPRLLEREHDPRRGTRARQKQQAAPRLPGCSQAHRHRVDVARLKQRLNIDLTQPPHEMRCRLIRRGCVHRSRRPIQTRTSQRTPPNTPHRRRQPRHRRQPQKRRPRLRLNQHSRHSTSVRTTPTGEGHSWLNHAVPDPTRVVQTSAQPAHRLMRNTTPSRDIPIRQLRRNPQRRLRQPAPLIPRQLGRDGAQQPQPKPRDALKKRVREDAVNDVPAEKPRRDHSIARQPRRNTRKTLRHQPQPK
jgi:hypothetical protein